MITSAKDLIGYRITTETGKAGKLHDLYFKDDIWAVRYFTAGTRRFLPSYEVLLNPLEIDRIDLSGRRVHVSQTKDRLRDNIRAYRMPTVSQQKERDILVMSGQRPYILPFAHWGAGGLAVPGIPGYKFFGKRRRSRKNKIRSVKHLIGYSINGKSGRIGRLDDFLLEDHYWMLRYLVVKTSRKRRILIIADRVEDISWQDRSIDVGLDEKEAAHAPLFDPVILTEANREEINAPDLAEVRAQ